MSPFCTAYCLVYSLPCPADENVRAKLTADPVVSSMVAAGQQAVQGAITPAQIAAIIQLIAEIAALIGPIIHG